MVRSVNGDHGSSVIPISGDDWLFLGRGRHVWLDNNNVHMNGLSGSTLSSGIEESGVSKVNQANNAIAPNVTKIVNAVNASKCVVVEKIDENDDYMFYCGGWPI